eukprot:GHRQ01025494.1.p1 GENE.GHRQ01025494.1~~GHRQ01025494.1.p1  ORF type:complete len:121 (+),score=11.64 GHRQ01025494.1:500-862(+)
MVEKFINLTCFIIHAMRKKRRSRSMPIRLTLLVYMMLQEQSPRSEHIQVPCTQQQHKPALFECIAKARQGLRLSKRISCFNLATACCCAHQRLTSLLRRRRDCSVANCRGQLHTSTPRTM